MEQKPGTALKVFGWTIVSLAIIGSILKMYHWPGSGPCIILIALTYTFFYLPLWFSQSLKSKEERLFVILQYFFNTLFVLAQTFKIMHWPYGMILQNIGFWTGIFVLVPITLWKLGRASKTSLFKFNNLVLLIYLLSFFQISLMRMSETNVGAGSIALGSHQAERAYTTVSSKSFHLYQALEQVSDKEKNIYYQKAQQLKTFTDSVEKYLQDFKLNIVRQVEDSGWINLDSFSIADIRRKTEIHVPTGIIVGEDPAKPKSGPFSGLELKHILNRYRDSVIKFVDEGSRPLVASGINLSTNDAYVEDYDENQDWVTVTFFNYPTITVLITLTNLQYEVRNAETEVLTNLLNNAINSSKDNIAGKIADLAFKLESEKQNREIENLQKEKELAVLRMQAKNQEIEDQNQTIGLFTLILFAVAILVFYVIRSNVIRRRINKQLEEQKTTIEQQKILVEEKNHEITDSINYAQRIQSSILPQYDEILSALPDSFVLFKPKDIVSGDFFWFAERHNKIFIAAADCTGHGVPGAFMSMLNSDKLNQAIEDHDSPGAILQHVNRGVKKALRQSDKEGSSRDGMDIALVCLNKERTKLTYAAANRPLWIVRNNTIIIEETKATKIAIGGLTEDDQQFTEHVFDLQKGDTVYIFSDGYADQFSPEDKKLMTRNFKEKIISMQSMSMQEQKIFLDNYIEQWRGTMEQTDDILVIGVRV